MDELTEFLISLSVILVIIGLSICVFWVLDVQNIRSEISVPLFCNNEGYEDYKTLIMEDGYFMCYSDLDLYDENHIKIDEITNFTVYNREVLKK